MAINWRFESQSPTVDSLKRKILPACVAGAVVIAGVNLLAEWLVDESSRKIAANQIVSPWDKKQIPPILGASNVVMVKREKIKPVLAEDSERRSVTKHRWRSHHWRRHAVRQPARADSSKDYQSF